MKRLFVVTVAPLLNTVVGALSKAVNAHMNKD